MKIIEAGLELYNDEDHQANGNTNGQSRYINDSVIPVALQTSGCGFEMVFKHAYLLCDGKKRAIVFVKNKTPRTCQFPYSLIIILIAGQKSTKVFGYDTAIVHKRSKKYCDLICNEAKAPEKSGLQATGDERRVVFLCPILKSSKKS